jgi:tRNA pseudouridine38-40 synthase
MPRYRLTLEYDGGPFVGWQRQDNGPSVQAALEEAIFALSGERTAVAGAGRTDAGVHALGQVAHFDLRKAFAAEKLRDALNHHLRPAPLVLERGRAWHLMRDLDADTMRDAAQALVGHHDFTTFRAAECQAKSPEKTLDRLDVRRVEHEVHIEARARSFLHHQVRSMVGSLKLVGEGKWTVRDLAAALAARDRSACGEVAPPDGLYLVRVDY